jgi:hypothetical protein
MHFITLVEGRGADNPIFIGSARYAPLSNVGSNPQLGNLGN